MKLNIPYITQRDGMHEGAACVEMILRYYGVSVSPETVERFLHEKHGGTDMAQIGRLLQQCGFHAELLTMHPRLFAVDDKNLSQENLLMALKKRRQFFAGSKHDRFVVENMVAYIEEGGRITPEAPTFDRVKIELDAGRPAVGLFATKFLTKDTTSTEFHYVVITGYRDQTTFAPRKIFMHNPFFEAIGFFGSVAHQSVPAERFFRGIYAREDAHIDDGGMLLIRKDEHV